MRRTVLALSVTAVLGGLALPSFAGQPTLPVGVQYDLKGQVFVGTTILGQPGAAARVQNGQACVGFSYQMPQCVGAGPISR